MLPGWLPPWFGDGWRDLRGGWRRQHRPLTVMAVVVVVFLLFAGYLAQSRSLGTNADGASFVLQASDMLHGNWLLRGWWLSAMPVYTTELPEYMLVELARGVSPDVINVAGAATFTVLLLLAALLAKGRATGTEALARVLITVGIMFAPGPPVSSGTLLNLPDHIGTQVPLLLIWLAMDRLADRWYLPWLAGLLLTWVEIADQMAVYVGAAPVIVVSAIRLYQRRVSWRIDAGLLVAAAVSVIAAAGIQLVIRRSGGFVVVPTPAVFVPSAQMPHNLWLTVESGLALFGADFFGMRLGPAAAAVLLHFAGVGLVAWACCIAARRLLSAADRLVPVLFLGIAINLAAYLLSTQAMDLGSTHELAAVLPFGAVLAGRLLPGRLVAAKLVPALLAVLVCYMGVFAYYASRPARPPATQAVASWLLAHHLAAGLGDYWAANITTVAAGGRVRVRPVTISCGRFAPYAWEAKESWYQQPNTATFLVLSPSSGGGPANGATAEAAAQFGPAQRTARIGGYQVMVWDHDLIAAVTSGFPRGCGQRWLR
jgi:hypothetical protein